MWDFNFRQAFGLMLRTMPFILLRCAVYFGITLAFVLITGLGAGVGYGIGIFGTSDFQITTTAVGGFAGFGLAGMVLYFLRSYLLYMVSAAHIAVLVELIDGKPLPEGRGQIEHGRKEVTERFAQSNILFGLDMLIKGVVNAISGLIRGIISFIPGADRLTAVINAFLKISLSLIDEVILAYIIRTRSNNPWDAGKTALVLYAQNAKPILKNALWLTLFSYAFLIVVFVLALTPAAALSWFFPNHLSALSVLFALLLAWSIKAAMLDPLILTCLLQVYFKHTEGQQANPEWEARLESASSKFREMKEKAMSTMRTQTASSSETSTNQNL